MRNVPDNPETSTKIGFVKNLLKLLDTIAIVRSQHKIPRKIAELYRIKWWISYLSAVFAKTDPYIPSQNKIVKGLEIDMRNPDKNEERCESVAFR